MRRRVHKTATLPPFPHALTEVLTCVQFAMHSDLPRDIPFIPFTDPPHKKGSLRFIQNIDQMLKLLGPAGPLLLRFSLVQFDNT